MERYREGYTGSDVPIDGIASVFEHLGIHSADECVGVAGLTIGLLGITNGVVGRLLLVGGFAAWATVVAGLFVGWVAFLYCDVRGETH